MSECKMSLLVRNLRYETSPERVRRHFEQFGDVRDVYLPLHYRTKKPRGFGFVEFFDESEARECLKHLHRSTLDGNEISVTIAQQGRKSPDTMRQRDRREDYDDNRGGTRYSSRSRSPAPHRRRGRPLDNGRDSVRYDDDRHPSRDRYVKHSDDRSRSRSFDRYDNAGYRRRDGRRNDKRRRDLSRSPSPSRRQSPGVEDEHRDGGRWRHGKGSERSRRSPRRRSLDARNADCNDAPHNKGAVDRAVHSDRSRSGSEARRSYDSRAGSPRRVIEETAETANYDCRRSCSREMRGDAPVSRSRSPVRQEECDYGHAALGDDQHLGTAAENTLSGAGTGDNVEVGGLDEDNSNCNEVDISAGKRSRSGSQSPEA